jgi:hypothetical protein
MRRTLLLIVLLGCLGAWLLLLGIEWSYQEGANYSLIEPGLYMGGAVRDPPPGTTAVLNLCQRDDPYRCDSYLWESIPDSAPAPDLDWLRRMVEYVASRRRAGDTVFVHCSAGVSRAGMVVTAYEMLKNHWTRDEALAFVRAQRPIANPNPAFMQLLLDWEHALKEEHAAAGAGAERRAPKPDERLAECRATW